MSHKPEKTPLRVRRNFQKFSFWHVWQCPSVRIAGAEARSRGVALLRNPNFSFWHVCGAQVCELREQRLDQEKILFWEIQIYHSDMFGGAQVCELREKRLDQEETLAEFQKAADTLKKDQEALMKKEKIIDQALKQTDDEIQQFQTFKQQKLNEIQVNRTYHSEYLWSVRILVMWIDIVYYALISLIFIISLMNEIMYSYHTQWHHSSCGDDIVYYSLISLIFIISLMNGIMYSYYTQWHHSSYGYDIVYYSPISLISLISLMSGDNMVYPVTFCTHILILLNDITRHTEITLSISPHIPYIAHIPNEW